VGHGQDDECFQGIDHDDVNPFANVHSYLTFCDNVMVFYLMCSLDDARDSVALTAHAT